MTHQYNLRSRHAATPGPRPQVPAMQANIIRPVVSAAQVTSGTASVQNSAAHVSSGMAPQGGRPALIRSSSATVLSTASMSRSTQRRMSGPGRLMPAPPSLGNLIDFDPFVGSNLSRTREAAVGTEASVNLQNVNDGLRNDNENLKATNDQLSSQIQQLLAQQSNSEENTQRLVEDFTARDEENKRTIEMLTNQMAVLIDKVQKSQERTTDQQASQSRKMQDERQRWEKHQTQNNMDHRDDMTNQGDGQRENWSDNEAYSADHNNMNQEADQRRNQIQSDTFMTEWVPRESSDRRGRASQPRNQYRPNVSRSNCYDRRNSRVNQARNRSNNAVIYEECEDEYEQGNQPRQHPDRPGRSKYRPKLPNFTGNERFEVWITQFEEALYQWSDEEKLDELIPKLRDAAADFVFGQLTPDTRADYQELVTQLSLRFRTVETPKMFQAQLENRKQKVGESIHDYASELKRLYDKAYPGRPTRVRNEDLVKKFMKGLIEEEVGSQVEYHKSPSTIDQAVYEVSRYLETVKSSKSTMSMSEGNLCRVATELDSESDLEMEEIFERVMAPKYKHQLNKWMDKKKAESEKKPSTTTNIQIPGIDMEELKKLIAAINKEQRQEAIEKRKSHECTKCHKIGHYESQCFSDRPRRGAPRNATQQGVSQQSGVSAEANRMSTNSHGSSP